MKQIYMKQIKTALLKGDHQRARELIYLMRKYLTSEV